jgi:membrane-associated phospholipid phosphatase
MSASATELGRWWRRIEITLLDAVQFFSLAALGILQIVLWHRVPESHVLLPVYAGCVALLAASIFMARPGSRPGLKLLDDLIVPILILLVVFETLGYSIPALNTNWLEHPLVRMDSWFFGMTGSEYLQRFYSAPLLDLMHVFYVSFYFVPLSLLILIYRRGNRADFQLAVAAIGLTFYADFLLYYVFPVLGPYRNPQIHFTRDIMASGGTITRVLRGFLDHAEIVAYDCFPSGHVAATLVSILLAYRFRLAVRGIYVFLGVMIAISTVYLRYHYVMDLVAGALVALVIYRIAPYARGVVVFSGKSGEWCRYFKEDQGVA